MAEQNTSAKQTVYIKIGTSAKVEIISDLIEITNI